MNSTSPDTTTSPAEFDLHVTVAGVEIPCRLTQPAGVPRAAVLLLPGSLYSDVDGNYPSMNLRPHAYADLARQLAGHGVAVLRMAKVGPGTGSRTVDEVLAQQHRDFHTRVDVAAAGLALLTKHAPARPLVVAGHSEGAKVAALLAARDATDVAGIVILSGAAQRLLDLLRDQIMRMGPPGAPSDPDMIDRAIAAIRTDTPLPEQARAHPQTAMLANMPPAAHQYLRSVDLVDPCSALGAVMRPVLIVHGERDDSVPVEHARMLLHARASLPTTLVTFPGLTHFYKLAPPGLAPMQSMALDSDSDPAVAATVARWMDGLASGAAAH